MKSSSGSIRHAQDVQRRVVAQHLEQNLGAGGSLHIPSLPGAHSNRKISPGETASSFESEYSQHNPGR